MASFRVLKVNDHDRTLVLLSFYEKRETPTGVESILVRQERFTPEMAKLIGTRLVERATELTNDDGDDVSLLDDTEGEDNGPV